MSLHAVSSSAVPYESQASPRGGGRDADLDRATMAKVSGRILPFVFVLYIFNFLDRSNVGVAALQMNQALGFSSSAFGLGAGIFFIGYALFEVPSNLLLVRFGARKWIARIMITWGVLAAAMMFVRTPSQFYVLRFMLGVAEAGFFPAILYYLSQWFPASMRASSGAKFMIAIPLSGLLGGPLGGWLLGFNGLFRLGGWQWLFLIEGIPSVLLGVVVLRYLTEQPAEAKWLSPPEREWLTRRLLKDRDESPANHGLPPLRALAHPLVWLAALPELLVTTAGYGYLFWGPLLIRDTLRISNAMTGLLTGGIAIMSAGGMLLVGKSSDARGERPGHAAACAAFVALGCIGAAMFVNPMARFASLVLMQVAVICFLAPFWAIPTMLLSGTSAAIGIALVNAIGNVGGFIGPYAIGFLRTRTGGDTGAFLGLASMALLAAALCLLLKRSPLLAGAPSDMNVGSLLPRHARYRGDHLALVCGDTRLTFAEFGARVNQVSNALRSVGLGKGDKLAVVMPNCREVLEIYWGAIQIGVVLVPLSPLLRGPALAALLTDSHASAVIAAHDLAGELDPVRAGLPAIRANRWLATGGETSGYRDYETVVAAQSADAPPRVEIAGDDLFNIIYSSGTTGTPKGIVHTHDIRAMYCTLFAAAFRFTPESVVLHVGSLVFNGAFVTLMPALFLGTTYVLQQRFDAEECIEIVEREQVTHVMLVPSQILAVMRARNFSREKLRSLQMLGSVGAPLHREHKDRLTTALPNVFYELYGLTEGVITILDRDDVARKANSVGISTPFFEVRIMSDDGRDLAPGEVGEIVGRSPLLMPGYYGRPDLTGQAIVDGWMHTGDMGYLDDDGYLYLVDRKKDLIISGGVNVYPKDIEEVVVTHPDVVEAAVFGIPNAKWGEAPLGAVVLRVGAVVDAATLKRWVNERVGARYQQLCEVVILDEFPRNAAGKTLKRLMRDEYWKDREAAI